MARTGAVSPSSPSRRVYLFVAVLLVVIAIQGTYLGLTVGVLTSIERRFDISTGRTGSLLSFYDVGHTLAVLFIGYFGANSHKPRITAIGVLCSSLAMFAVALPIALFGFYPDDQSPLHDHLQMKAILYRDQLGCSPKRFSLFSTFSNGDNREEALCQDEAREHWTAYIVLCLAQIFAGIAASPFNTLAYVYIDENLSDRRQSPLALGLCTSMYAFAPAFGFVLSAIVTRIYIDPGNAPNGVSMQSEHWVGAWWIGYVLCGILYLIAAIPLFFFPKSLLQREDEKAVGAELQPLRHEHHHEHHREEETNREHQGWTKRLANSMREFPSSVWTLIKNPVYSTMVIGWMLASYLVGGYSTYLPKFIETQYGQSASIADLNAVAVSTALGGWILARFNLKPRTAMLALLIGWALIAVTYLIGMTIGCTPAHLQQWQENCNSDCNCHRLRKFEPVHDGERNFLSPCTAGCRNFDMYLNRWDQCSCVDNGNGAVEDGLMVDGNCPMLYVYVAVMFIGFFIGNLFFMTTMMVVLRCVYDDQRVLALSLASCLTNLLGFIPAPIIFGLIIDGTCTIWHSNCQDRGHCVVYDHDQFRIHLHLWSAVLQIGAVLAVLLCYLVSRRRILPEEEEEEVQSGGQVYSLRQ